MLWPRRTPEETGTSMDRDNRPMISTFRAAVRVTATITGLTCAVFAASAQAQDIIPSPAFTGEELAAQPNGNWVANGGNVLNQRYSPLDQINRENVKDLKAVWRASLQGSGVTPRAGNQAEVLYYEGTLYAVTSANDVFAIDIESGEIIWKYEANYDPEKIRACCGFAVRGIAMGDGKIFVGRLDARMVALDQKTGKVVWDVQAEDPSLGFSITSAPRYYDGLVITGFAGGDLGTRGRVNAYDARTGELVWRFYTIPGPGEFGHDTWPQDSDVWKYGGAPVWQTPAVDPELGLVIFSTGNPGPVLNGYLRPGDNLFANSVVAIDAKTGEYRWHFQEVHHDIWDYDAPNPVILFDAEIDGKMRKGVAQAGKTGWVYLLDRVTGEPLIGIEEKPVMQEPKQHTAATQPYPIGDAIVPQYIDIQPEGYKLVNEGRIFTPFADEPVLWKPLAAMNWPPSSYDPEQHLMYICAQDAFWGAEGGDPDYPVEPGELYSGSVVQRVAGARRGIFAALDVTTNRLAWRQQWADTCYSGSIATGGGLVFVGRNDGRYTALNSTNGDKLWTFQTDGGVNATGATFTHEGKQYVAVYAGGTVLGGSKRSDGVWLFSLDGKMESLPRGAADPTGQFSRGPAAPDVTPIEGREADLKRGSDLYFGTCGACHGETGQGGTHGGAPLTPELTVPRIMTIATNGQGDMPAFGGAFTREDLQDIATFILEDLIKRQKD